ncbi:uncharacterized protein LOC143285467 [Babylonia areolata]|uniref:uncharacterized protein LOC143285467 n=1 Tax=Babylonia areolata TaxID=304850 RepID=UPI003FD36C51
MAEGGGEEDQINPFSFKTYVKKKTRQQEEQDVDTDDIFAITGPTASNRKKEKQSLVVAEDDDESPKTKKKGNKENPFSFKKFIGQSGQKDSPSSQRRPISQDARTNGATPAGLSTPSSGHGASSSFHAGPSPAQHSVAPPDLASHLPDFIQNHFTDESSQQEHERRQMPDFTLQSRLSQNSVREREGNSGFLFGAGKEDSVGDSTFSDGEEEGVQRGRQLSLPDFLVDSAVPGAQGGGDDSIAVVAGARSQGGSSRSQLPELPPLGDHPAAGSAQSVASRSSDDSVLKQLQEENRQLKASLAQMRQRAREEETRVAGLEKEISRLRKKEAEETAVMERAVQQVEENLVATTTRAVQAETLVSRLKQDVKTLQGQVNTLTAENQALLSGDKGWSDIRERTTYASQQLATAAVTAETNLRELLNGVEKLKLLGQVLSSLEKVTDVDDSPTQEDKASPKSSSPV